MNVQSCSFRFLSILCCLLWCLSSMSMCGQQNPYQLNWGKDLALLGIGGASLYIGYQEYKKEEPLSRSAIARLNANDVGSLERSITENWSPRAADVSDVLLYGSLALPSLLMLDRPIRSNAATVGVLFLETALLNNGLLAIAKTKTNRIRPFVYNPNVPEEEKLEIDATFSFFSGHTSSTTALCFFSAKVFSDFYPNSRAKPFVWIGAAGISASVAYLRVAAGKHFVSDVVVGYAVGALLGWGIPHLHKRKDRRFALTPLYQQDFRGALVQYSF